MNKEKMEQLREVINIMLCSENYDQQQLLQKSQELDKLLYDEIKKSEFVKNTIGREHMKEFDRIINKFQEYESVYDTMRIVQPKTKEVFHIKDGGLHKLKSSCFELWNKEKMCDNCICMKAYQNDNIYIKIEKVKNKSYGIIAVPISIKGERLIAELIKELSSQDMVLNKKEPLLELDEK